MTGKIDKEAYIELETMIQSIDDIQMQFERGKAHGNIVTVLVNGKPEFWEINDPMLLESLTSMSQPKLKGLLAAYAASTRFMTANITGRNVIWSVFSNAPRDLMTFTAYSKNKNFAELIKGIGSAYINAFNEEFRDGKSVDPLYKEYLALGGGHTSVYSADIDLAKKARKKFTDSKYQKYLNWNPISLLGFIGDTVELGPRFATYKILRTAGMEPQEAFYEAMDITVNFRRSGEVGKSANSVIPFFNASVQGIDKFVRYFTAEDQTGEQRKKTIRTRLTGFIATSIIVAAIEYAINNYDDEHEKEYEQLSNYTKNTNWLIPLGGGRFLAIPKSRELAVPSSLASRALESTVGKNDKAFDEFGEYFADNMLPPIIDDVAKFFVGIPTKGMNKSAEDLIANAVGSAGIIGVFANMRANSDFLGRPIISDYMKDNIEAKDQYTRATSKAAFWIGQALDFSPMMIDYFGNQVLTNIWKPMKALMPIGEEYVDTTLGIKNTYVKDNLYSTDVINNMYNEREESKRYANSHPEDGAAQVKKKMDADMAKFYTEFNKLNNDNVNIEAKRAARQEVINIIGSYQNNDETGTFKNIKAVCEHFNDTALLPSVMKSTVTDDNETKHKLNDIQYIEYQTRYNNMYYEFVNSTLDTSEPMNKQRATILAAKKLAMDKATAETLKKVVGINTTKAIEKQGNIKDDDYIIFHRELDLADDDGSLKQQEVIDIIYDMYDRGISRKEANELFHVMEYSDKNNPFVLKNRLKK